MGIWKAYFKNFYLHTILLKSGLWENWELYLWLTLLLFLLYLLATQQLFKGIYPGSVLLVDSTDVSVQINLMHRPVLLYLCLWNDIEVVVWLHPMPSGQWTHLMLCPSHPVVSGLPADFWLPAGHFHLDVSLETQFWVSRWLICFLVHHSSP